MHSEAARHARSGRPLAFEATSRDDVEVEAEAIRRHLDAIRDDDDFVGAAYDLTDAWESAGFEVVKPILRFMEANPSIDYGSPGPLVHLVERWFGKGLEAALLTSLERRPTCHTIWMLRRVINGTTDVEALASYVDALRATLGHPSAGEAEREEAREMLDGLE